MLIISFRIKTTCSIKQYQSTSKTTSQHATTKFNFKTIIFQKTSNTIITGPSLSINKSKPRNISSNSSSRNQTHLPGSKISPTKTKIRLATVKLSIKKTKTILTKTIKTLTSSCTAGNIISTRSLSTQSRETWIKMKNRITTYEILI